jgi:holdfast attachment protein HfaA
MTRIPSASFALAALGVLASVSAAGAQSFPGAAPQAGGVSSLEAGYGGAGRVASQPFQPSTRDANGNRLVVNGRIIDSRGQASTTYTSERGAGLSSSSATAIGNLISVQVSGRNNTVVLNARQVNNGQLNARVDL